MNIYRYEENPLVTPADVKPYHDGFEVIGAFNAGVAEYNGEVSLLRVAERPISSDPMIVKAPVFNADTQKLDILEFRTDDARYDFSDPRVIRNVNQSATFEYLTSLSYIRVARSRTGTALPSMINRLSIRHSHLKRSVSRIRV